MILRGFKSVPFNERADAVDRSERALAHHVAGLIQVERDSAREGKPKTGWDVAHCTRIQQAM
jgi:hypothetical protein